MKQFLLELNRTAIYHIIERINLDREFALLFGQVERVAAADLLSRQYHTKLLEIESSLKQLEIK